MGIARPPIFIFDCYSEIWRRGIASTCARPPCYRRASQSVVGLEGNRFPPVIMGEVGRSFRSRFFRWLGKAIWILCQALLVAWGSLVIYFSNLPGAEARIALTVCFSLVSIWLLWLSRERLAFAAFVLLFVGVVAWSV